MNVMSNSQQAMNSAGKLFEAMQTLRRFIPAVQMQTIGDLCKGEEGEYFRDKLASVANLVATMPKTYEQDGMGDNAIVHLHYFTGGCDWYITERDMETVQHQAFGYTNLGYGGELGYISLVELCQHPSVELDLHWTPKELSKVKLAEAA